MNPDREENHRRMIAGEMHPTHGKVSTYVHYLCRCAECTAAHTLYRGLDRTVRELRRVSGFGDFEHGSSGYRNWGCRCETCSAGHAEKMRDRRHLIKDDRHGTSTNYSYGCRCGECRAAQALRRKTLRPPSGVQSSDTVE